jgi:hypothetical protein
MSKMSDKTKELHSRLSSVLAEKGLLEETPEFSHEFAVTGRTHNESAVLAALPLLIEKCEEAPSILFLKRYILKEGKVVYGWTFGSFGVPATTAHKHMETLIRAITRVSTKPKEASINTQGATTSRVSNNKTSTRTPYAFKVIEQTWDGNGKGQDVVEIPLPHVTGPMNIRLNEKSKGVDTI